MKIGTTFRAVFIASLLSSPLSVRAQEIVPHDISFEDLTYVNLNNDECRIELSSGSAIASLIEQDSRAAPALLLTGQTRLRLRLGERLYLTTGNPLKAYRALVVQSSEEKATIAVSLSVVGELIYQGRGIVFLGTSTNDPFLNRRTLSFDSGEVPFRGQLAGLLDCYETMGAD